MFSNSSFTEGRIDIMYSKVHNIYLKSKDKEDRRRTLRVKVERDTGLSPVCQKILSVHLSDDEDPYYVCGLSLGEEEFKILKEQQNLLVDFDHFFDHLVRLFDLCQQDDKPRFLLVLTSDEDSQLALRQAQLQVMEITNFKHLCHLSLTVNNGTDLDVKKHMAGIIKSVQDENDFFKRELKTVQLQLEEVSVKLEHKSSSCDQLISKCMEEKAELHSALTRELVMEKEKSAKALVEMQKNVELEKNCLDDKYLDIIRNLETQISSLKVQLNSSMEKSSQTEYYNRELKNQVDCSQKEMANLQKELASLKKQNGQLDFDYHEKERAVQSLRTRFAVLEQELKDKSEMLTKQQESAMALGEQKKTLEHSLKEKEKFIQHLETSLATLSEDFIKANEILTIRQNDYLAMKSKVQISTNIALEQEKVLEAKTKELSAVTENLDDSTKRIKSLEEEIVDLKANIQTLEKMSEEKDKKLKINGDVIDRLTRRLNDTTGQQTSAGQPPLWRQSIFYPRGMISPAIGMNPHIPAVRPMGPFQQAAVGIGKLGPASKVQQNRTTEAHSRADVNSEDICMGVVGDSEPKVDQGDESRSVFSSNAAEGNPTSSARNVSEEALIRRRHLRSAFSGILRNEHTFNPSAYFNNGRKE